MQITLINLDRSADRLAEFRQVNAHLKNVARYSAHDGRTIDRAKLLKDGIFDPATNYSDAELGCALSHLALWQQAIDSQQPVTIIEDDAILNRRFEIDAPELIGRLPADWDIILWGWNFDSILMSAIVPGVPCLSQFSQDLLRLSIEAFQSATLIPGAQKVKFAFGALAYTLSPKGAAALKKHALPIRPFTVPIPLLNKSLTNFGIDCVMNSLYPELAAYVAVPPLVVTRNDSAESTIAPGAAFAG